MAHTQAVKAAIPNLFSATRFVTYIRQKVKTSQPAKEDTLFILISIFNIGATQGKMASVSRHSHVDPVSTSTYRAMR